MGGDNEKHRPYYRLDTTEVVRQLGASRTGLSINEARKRLSQYGLNHLEQSDKDTWFGTYLRQYKDMMILLLLVSSGVAFYLGDTRTGPALLGIVLINTFIGFFQEFKAEKIMETLQGLVIAEAKVLRNEKLTSLNSQDLVPGDVVYIEEGDSVPADLRLLTESELSSNDFALTGESNPSRKFTHAIGDEVPLGNRHNLVFMGTTIATGHAYGVVIATGMRTELGRIAHLSQDTGESASPLQKEINHTASLVTKGTVLVSCVLLLIGTRTGIPFREMLLYAVGVASSLIPQGLPAEINTALSQAAGKLAKARALVKKLSAVETLGATSIICTDKTGTLTKNEMTVIELQIGRDRYYTSGSGYENNGSILDRNRKKLDAKQLENLSLFFKAGVLASNARIGEPDDQHAEWYVVGDPTEGALITLGNKANLTQSVLETENPELREFAFDSARKLMSSIRKFGTSKQPYVFVKGSPESVLDRCEDIWDHGHVRPIIKADRDLFNETNKKWADSAQRNLAFAYRVLPAGTNPKKLKMEDVEDKLVFLGMISMVDPLREDVAPAMHSAHDAHIRVSIITGDFAPTAKAIAKKAGLGKGTAPILVVSGEELKDIDDNRLLFLVKRGSVIFSRVSPEDKLRIVGLVKDNGSVVAVTGDGINDAPALKRADIGVAMGRTGTDVAKQSADIVLLDDSFNTLVGAIQQGRIIFQNIKKGALSCFTTNAAELIVNLVSLGASAIFGIPLALTIMQILAIDLIAELFPIAALGWDGPEREMMQEKPRNPKDHILNRKSITDLLWCGILIGGLAFANYMFVYMRAGISAETVISGAPLHMQATAMTYLTIVLCQFVNILQRRSQHGFFTRYQFQNKPLLIAMTFSMFCVLNIIYNPVIAPYFGAGPLRSIDWVFAFGAASIFLFVRELQRYANKHHSREQILSLLTR